MINIDKYAEIKQDISLLIVCNTKNLEVSLRNNFNSDESSYILSNYEQNKKKFFAFNHLNRFVLVSIVEEKDDSNATMEMYRRVGGKVLRECDKNFIKDLQLYTLADKNNVLAFVEGMLESSYIFDKYKTDPTRLIHPFDNLHIIGTEVDENDINQKRIVFLACEKAKDLVNEPVEVINATNLSKYFTELSKQAGIEIDVWNKAKID